MANLGFSIGDIVTVGSLAWNVYKACSNATPEFQEAVREVKSLLTAIEQLEHEASKPDSVVYKAVATKRSDFQSLVQNIEQALKQFTTLVEKYKSLGTKKRKKRDVVRFSAEEIDNVRSKISLHIIAINLFLSAASAASLARIEVKLDEVFKELHIGQGHTSGPALQHQVLPGSINEDTNQNRSAEVLGTQEIQLEAGAREKGARQEVKKDGDDDSSDASSGTKSPPPKRIGLENAKLHRLARPFINTLQRARDRNREGVRGTTDYVRGDPSKTRSNVSQKNTYQDPDEVGRDEDVDERSNPRDDEDQPCPSTLPNAPSIPQPESFTSQDLPSYLLWHSDDTGQVEPPSSSRADPGDPSQNIFHSSSYERPARPADLPSHTYTCPYQGCTRTFRRRWNLQMHMKDYCRSQRQLTNTSMDEIGLFSPLRRSGSVSSISSTHSEVSEYDVYGNLTKKTVTQETTTYYFEDRSRTKPTLYRPNQYYQDPWDNPPMFSSTVPEATKDVHLQVGPHKCTRTNPSTNEPCNAIFSRPYDLTRHEDTVHNNRKTKFRCQHCREEKSFSREDALKRHMRVVHSDVDSLALSSQDLTERIQSVKERYQL